MSNTAKPTVVQKAILLHQAGELDQADTVYARILKSKPKHIDVLHMRGVLKFQQGKHKLAAHLLNKALDHGGDDPWIHFHLAEVSAAVGEHRRAVKHYTHAIEGGACEADVYYMHGNSLFELGHMSEAIASYKNALTQQPDDTACMLNLANAYEVVGEIRPAIDLLVQLVSMKTSPLSIKLQLVELLVLEQQLLKAHTYVQSIKVVHSKDVEHVLSIVRLLHTQGRYESVNHLLDLLTPQLKTLDSQFFDLAIGLLNDTGRYVDARKFLETQTQYDKRSAWSWFQQGLCAQVEGDFEQAELYHRRALLADDTLGTAAYSLATNGDTRIEKALLDDWSRKQTDSSIPEQQRARFAFAVAHTLDRDHEFDEAFYNYERANGLIAQAQPFNATQWVTNIEALIQTFSKDFFAAMRDQLNLDALPAIDSGEELIFIVGMPRSGSTLLEQLLSQRLDVIGLGEHHALRSINADVAEITGFTLPAPQCARAIDGRHLEQLRRRYRESLPRHTGGLTATSGAGLSSGFIDKMLGNFLRLGVLALMFPGARVLHSCRNPMATGVSCYTNAFISGMNFTYDLNAMGVALNCYERLMQHWHEVLPLAIMDVHYESLVSDSESQLQAVFQFLNLEPLSVMNSTAAESNEISTASFWQARQPISMQSVDAWRRFEQHLDPLRSAHAKGVH